MTSPSIDKISETLNEIFPDNRLEVAETLEKEKMRAEIKFLINEIEILKDQIDAIKEVLFFTNLPTDKELCELIKKI